MPQEDSNINEPKSVGPQANGGMGQRAFHEMFREAMEGGCVEVCALGILVLVHNEGMFQQKLFEEDEWLCAYSLLLVCKWPELKTFAKAVCHANISVVQILHFPW